MAKFTVDTHLFRELGELLVGRDSTALIELIKNAYDADATQITVEGSDLESGETGRILIWDNGIGMTPEIFENGFLRIASRQKELGARKSAIFRRRYTGQKGVGRLAAHKLASHMLVNSVPNVKVYGRGSKSIDAFVDWDRVEEFETLDQIDTSALGVEPRTLRKDTPSGTLIELRRLRRHWTPAERSRFFLEVQTFRPPNVLVNIPEKLFQNDLLIRNLAVSDAKRSDPGFDVELLGDLETGEEYWQALIEAAAWLIEIDATKKQTVEYQISPTVRTLKELPNAEPQQYSIDYPGKSHGPRFQARILVRSGSTQGSMKSWIGRMTGVRVYTEGFRVLPYGEPSDDWLELNADYRRRGRTLRFLDQYDIEGERRDPHEGLSVLGNDSYFGAVFLTQANSGQLRMLVNREGFVPDASFDSIKEIVRVGIDLSVRVNAAAGAHRRALRREQRAGRRASQEPSPRTLKLQVQQSVEKAQTLAREAREAANTGQIQRAALLVTEAASEFQSGSDTGDRLLTEPSIIRMLAAVGTQMASFVHEMNALLGMAQSIEESIKRIRADTSLNDDQRRHLGRLASSVGDLRRIVERQASYLSDITAPDARRRRSRLKIRERAEAAVRLVSPAADRAKILINNKIPEDLKTPPMFPAELTLVFSNLLTNAVKAAEKSGKIELSARSQKSGTRVRIENTGKRVRLRDAEKWFRPFESTTKAADPYLGQGMGMGLPITRNMLEEYGAEIHFVKPRSGFSTAIEVIFY